MLNFVQAQGKRLSFFIYILLVIMRFSFFVLVHFFFLLNKTVACLPYPDTLVPFLFPQPWDIEASYLGNSTHLIRLSSLVCK